MQTLLRRVRWKAILVAGAVLVGAIIFRKPAVQVGRLVLGGAAMAFLLMPLAERLEGALSRPLAALMALLLAVGAVAGLLWLFLPVLVREASQLWRRCPAPRRGCPEWAGRCPPGVQRACPGSACLIFPWTGSPG